MGYSCYNQCLGYSTSSYLYLTCTFVTEIKAQVVDTPLQEFKNQGLLWFYRGSGFAVMFSLVGIQAVLIPGIFMNPMVHVCKIARLITNPWSMR